MRNQVLSFTWVCLLALESLQDGVAKAAPYYYTSIPTYFHSCRMNGGLTESDLVEYDVGSHKIVTIEKGEGLFNSQGNSRAEDRISKACQLVKSSFPSMPCYSYVNQLLSWPYYQIDDDYVQLMNEDDSIVYYTNNGDKTFPQSKNIRVFDFTNPQAEDWWVDEVAKHVETLQAAGYVDGVFVDRAYVGKKEANRIKVKSRRFRKSASLKRQSNFESYSVGKERALDALAARGISMIANPGSQYYGRYQKLSEDHFRFREILKGPNWIQLEEFCVHYTSIYKLNQAILGGKNVQAHGGMIQCGGKYKCYRDIRAFLSAYLMGMEDHTTPDAVAAGLGESMFACHRHWTLDSDEKKNRNGGREFKGFKEYGLALGVPDDRVSDSDTSQTMMLERDSEKTFSALRPFRNEITNELQAVAVWTKRVKTVCFVTDCEENDDPRQGKYCTGNHKKCNEYLDLFA